MTRSIARSHQSDEDLLDIWNYIAQNDPAAADRTIDRIEQRWLQLLDQPFSGMGREDIGRGVRQLTAGPYLILYRVSGNIIDIVRILHGRRDLTAETMRID